LQKNQIKKLHNLRDIKKKNVKTASYIEDFPERAEHVWKKNTLHRACPSSDPNPWRTLLPTPSRANGG
jgi:hypothetical protein